MSIRDEISRIEQAKSDIKSAIIEKGVEVPDSAKINEYAEQISMIPTGANVQRYEGTFTTDENGEATVDCGFQPDIVTIPIGLMVDNTGRYEIISSIDFTSTCTDEEKKTTLSWTTDDSGTTGITIIRKLTGFEVTMVKFNWNWRSTLLANESFNFVAIKFSNTNGQNSGVAYHVTLINDTYIDENDGSEIYYAGWSATDYLSCAGVEDILIRKLQENVNEYKSIYNAFYDENKQFISSFATDFIDSYLSLKKYNDMDKIPENAAFVRFSHASEILANYRFIPIW